jgi:hypothetical protein
VIHPLGNADPFLPECDALGERAQLSMTHGEEGTGGHGRQDSDTEAFATPCPVEERRSLSAAVDRPTIVALAPIGCAEVEVRQRLHEAIPTGRGEHEGTLGGDNGLVIRAPVEAIVCQRDRDLCQPTWVVEGHCESLSLTQRR